MTKSKSYNRIVFLTTLSVYLGLVLVGGTAPVLAHSALTKNFDIRNEIGVKDDLDNKPDTGEVENSADTDFPTLFAQLLNTIKEEADKGVIKLPIPNEFHYSNQLTEFSEGSGVSSNPDPNSRFDQLAYNSISEFLRQGRKLADYAQGRKYVKAEIEKDYVNLSLKISLTKAEPAQFAEFLNNKFSSSAKSAEDNLLKQIYESTKVTAENNQVFIVTRLPRGSIDSLLAKND